MGGSSVNGRLNLIQSGLEDRLAAIKTDIDLEEGLEDLLGKVTATTDSLLHLVERVFGGVEEGLVHGPRVILGQLLDLLRADGLNMLIERVGADSVDQVLDGLFNFVVLALKLLGLGVDPFGLHLNELVEGVGSGVGGQVDEHGLGECLQVVLGLLFFSWFSEFLGSSSASISCIAFISALNWSWFL